MSRTSKVSGFSANYCKMTCDFQMLGGQNSGILAKLTVLEGPGLGVSLYLEFHDTVA